MNKDDRDYINRSFEILFINYHAITREVEKTNYDKRWLKRAKHLEYKIQELWRDLETEFERQDWKKDFEEKGAQRVKEFDEREAKRIAALKL